MFCNDDKRDVFNKCYTFDMVKIYLKTKSSSGMEFSTYLHSYTGTGKASGNLETKYKIYDCELTFIQKWNRDNILGKEISTENKLKEIWSLNADQSILFSLFFFLIFFPFCVDSSFTLLTWKYI
uniref:Uncharacterized protein n=1 Tax=Vombatus ursinus TaxID=29139 RepID=A0A4X2K505_VOMUR